MLLLRLGCCLPACPAASCSSSLLPPGRPDAAAAVVSGALRQPPGPAGHARTFPRPAQPLIPPSGRCVPFNGMPALHALCARTDRADAAQQLISLGVLLQKLRPRPVEKKATGATATVSCARRGGKANPSLLLLASIVLEGVIHMGVVILTAGAGRGEEFFTAWSRRDRHVKV